MSHGVSPAFALAVLAGLPATLLAQANYAESFQNLGSTTAGGPSALVSRGWVFRNQSRPAGTGVSPYWTEMPGWGQPGSALGHGNFATWQDASSQISAWAILPVVPGQIAGDPLSVWTSGPQSGFGTNPATIEVRYSPSGGSSTGSSETSVGDFTTLLGAYSGPHAWTRHVFTLPGPGRIAFRLVMGPGSNSDVLGGSMLIDTLQVGAPPAAPYPLPAAGQTVHWTLANSPVRISRTGTGENPTLAAGGTVVVDPGVEVRFDADASLDVRGTLRPQGTAASPVRFTGSGSMQVLPGGLVEASHADVQSFTDIGHGGRASFTDSSFSDPALPTGFSYNSKGDIGKRIFDGDLDSRRQVLRLERCTFGQGCDVALLKGWLSATDCTFTRGQVVSSDASGPVGGEAVYVAGNAYLDNVTIVEGFADLVLDNTQHRYVGNVNITGNGQGPALRLEGGGGYLLDPNNTLQGNRWPVSIGINSAGILPGSSLPSQGNTFNEIPDTDDASPLGERVVRADPGIPYVILDNSATRGQVTALPGATFKMGPGVTFFFSTDSNGASMPIFLGEPGRPVRFTSYDPAQPWAGLTVGTSLNFGARWQWIELDHSTNGLGFNGMPLAIDNSYFHDNTRGIYTENYLSVRGSRFENNTYSITGERFAPNHEVRGFVNANHEDNPNSFINNHGTPYFGSFTSDGGLIARADQDSFGLAQSDLRNNWWGTSDGPRNPQNPGGSGDTVYFGNTADGLLLPFLTDAPAGNIAPVVRLVTPALTLRPGEQVVVRWTARDDDGSIERQRVEFSPDSNADDAFFPIAELTSDARSFIWTVPSVGTPANGADQFLRIISVDDQGREGVADLAVKILNEAGQTGEITPSPAITGVHAPGENLDACFTAEGLATSSIAGAIELDNDESGVSLGASSPDDGRFCFVLGATLPDVSTDRARIRYQLVGALNNSRLIYGPYFSIRPDALLGDAAPSVSLTLDPQGGVFAPGSDVVVAWDAGDDEGLRGFDIRASLDGGTRWFILERDLPSTARSYAWRAPAGEGAADVRLRVVAKDVRFQNTSAETGSFALQGGQPSICDADVNCDGNLDGFDVQAMERAVGGDQADFCQADPDFNHDGNLDAFDVQAVEATVAGSPCP